MFINIGVRGVTTRSIAALPFATATIRATGATATVSVL